MFKVCGVLELHSLEEMGEWISSGMLLLLLLLFLMGLQVVQVVSYGILCLDVCLCVMEVCGYAMGESVSSEMLLLLIKLMIGPKN